MPTKLVPITVRIDGDFYDIIVKQAKDEERSINGQINILIKLGYDVYKQTYKPKKNRANYK